MTTPSTARKAGPFTGTGSQTAWPFTFKVFAAGDIKVTATDANGDEVLLVLNTDYTVSLNANQETSPGGTVNYLLPSGRKLSIVGDLDYDQPLDLPSGGNYSPTALENQLDRTVMQIQQLAEGLDRAAKLPVTSAEDSDALVADLIRIADSADNLDTVAENITSVNVVAADLSEPVSEINTVATNIANVNTVGNNIGSVNTVAGIAANVTTVASIAANVTTAAGIAADVTAVAGNATNITAVAGNATNISAVAGNATNISAVAANEANIDAVAGISANVTTVAGISADIQAVADNVADVSNFADVYQGAKASDPTLRNDGSALQAGDLYFNTVDNALRAYSGTQWVAGTAGTINVQRFSGDGSNTTFTLASAPAGENNTQVYIGGVYQQKDRYSVSGTTLTFSSAPPSGADNIEVVTIATLALGETDAALVSAADGAGGTRFSTVQGFIDALASTAAGKGAELVAFKQAGTGAADRNAQSKLREVVSVFDFMTEAQIASVRSGSANFDASVAINAAINSNTSFLEVFIPGGDYRLDNAIIINRQNLVLRGAGQQTTLLPAAGVIAIQAAKNNGVSRLDLKNFRIYGLADADGGVELGNATAGNFVAFCKLQDLTITNFTEFGGFGVKLGQVQELDIDNCYIADNYHNIRQTNAAGNYLTSCHVHGASGYIGRSINVAILLETPAASLRFSDIVIESNGTAAAVITGASTMVSFENIHFEENGHAAPGTNTVYVSGTASLKATLFVNNCFFYANQDPVFRMDHTYAAFSNNVGLVDTGAIVPQTGCVLFFQSNRSDDGFSVSDPTAVYDALAASAKVSYFDKNGANNSVQAVDNIKFPSVQVPSSNPNTLDDYEEGTWTPSLVPATSGTITLGATNGRYTKIGNLVTVFATVVVSGVSSPAGELRLSGLPFAVGANGGGTFAPFAYGLAATATTSLVGVASAGNSYAVISKYAAGGVSNLSGDVIANAGLSVSFSYVV